MLWHMLDTLHIWNILNYCDYIADLVVKYIVWWSYSTVGQIWNFSNCKTETYVYCQSNYEVSKMDNLLKLNVFLRVDIIYKL